MVGVDAGSSTTKVSLVSIDDTVTELHTWGRRTPDAADALLATVAEGVRACVERSPEPIAAVGVASMAESGVPRDRAGAALSPLIRWNRATDPAHLAALLERHPGLPARTGIPPTPKPTLVALTALRRERPDVLDRMTRWSGVADLIADALTGAHVTDHTLAARTMMVARERSGNAGWDDSLVAELELSPDALPRILAPGETAGRTGDGAVAFGLGPGIPVQIAGHDHVVGAWAVGARHPGHVADSLGTAEAVVRIADGVDADSATVDGFAVGTTVDGAHATVVGGSPACGALLTLPELPGAIDVLAAADPRLWRTTADTVAPYPTGRQCPRPDPSARLIIPPGLDGDALARAVLQGLVLHARWMREAIGRHAGGADDGAIMLGSLAHRIPVWAPLAAAATGSGLHRCISAEPVATGAALLAAVREGLAAPDATLPTAPVTAAEAPGLADAYHGFLVAVGGETTIAESASTEGHA